MKTRKKSKMMEQKAAAMLLVMTFIALLSAFAVYAQEYHYFGKQDIINIIDSGKDIGQEVMKAFSATGEMKVDTKSIGFQKFVLIAICTLAGVIVNWEVNKSKGGQAPRGPPPEAGGGR